MNKVWVFIAIVLLVGLMMAAGGILFLRSFTQQTFSPLLEANQKVQTQVAQILHPTATILPDPISIVHQINTLARLETIQYSVEKIITAEVAQEPLGELFGDRLLFVAHGEVIAGVDLADLKTENLRIEKGLVTLKMPPAQVFTVRLDNDKSYVYDRETGLLTKGQKDLETQARQAAENEILETALEDGILEQARLNAEAYLLRFLNSLGFSNVVFAQSD